MSEPHEPAGGNQAVAAEEEEVRRLLEQAGPRAEVPPEDLAEIKAAFRAAWQEHLRRRGQQQARRLTFSDRRLWALAASILAALGIGWWGWSRGLPAASGPAARVESVTGGVTALFPQGDGEARATRLAIGAEIPTGTELETAGVEREAVGHAALRLAGGASLRLDVGSRVRLVSASMVELERGAVYLDSGGGPRRPRAVAVRTALGVAREVGTQFEVRLLGADAAMRVRVREGAVRLEGPAATYSAGAGTELTLRAGGSVTRRRIAGHGFAWRWVLQAAPPFEIEGLTLAEFLDRVGRETGWAIRYADEGLGASAGSIVLHGTVGQLTPDQALEVVLPGAGLRHEVVDGVLVIRADDDAPGR